MNLNIEITGGCNLRCPSCPRGRGDLKTTGKQMPPHLLSQILTKARRECRIRAIELYDTTEPTLHKDLPGMIRLAKTFGPVEISTNASIPGTDWDAIVDAEPDLIIVSISGDRPETHAKGHVGSDLNVVHAAMCAIDAAIRNHGKRTAARVLYHRYRYNLGEEIQAEERARSLGFQFAGLWAAVLHPHHQQDSCDCVLSPEDALRIGRRSQSRTAWCWNRTSTSTWMAWRHSAPGLRMSRRTF